ncbi:MAG: cupin domain-containing protein [Smithella sp.]|jgi:cupin 2 domain-containing protein
MKNLFADIPENLKEELLQTLLQTPCFHMEKIVSNGHCSPDGFWYDQDENEWVILLKGSAGLRFDGQKDVVVLKPGDYLHIDRHQKHRVEWTDPLRQTVWLAVHYKDHNTRHHPI